VVTSLRAFSEGLDIKIGYKEEIMPKVKVGGRTRKFPYTKKGKAAAKKFSKLSAKRKK